MHELTLVEKHGVTTLRIDGGQVSVEASTSPTVNALPEVGRLRDPEHPRYQIEEKVGEGGMAEVWRAYDNELRRRVAIKVSKRVAETTIRAEGELIANLQYPNIIPVYDIGTLVDGRTFYVMKLMEGRSLANVINQESWSQTKLLEAVRQVCMAVGFAHHQAVIHRDIKPSNIILGTQGEVFLSDWGIARLITEPADHDVIRGTPGYLAPEQFLGGSAAGSILADIFALGATLYRVVCGKRAYPPSVEITLAQFHLGEFAKVPDSVPDQLKSIIESALEPNPDKRIQSATELAESIDDYLNGAQEAQRRHERAQGFIRRAQAATKELDAFKIPQITKMEDPVAEVVAVHLKEEHERRYQEHFAGVTALWAHALQEEPTNREAEEGLARLYWQRAIELEEEERFREAALLEELARQTKPTLVSEWNQHAKLILDGAGYAVVEILEDFPIQHSEVVWSGPCGNEIQLDHGEYRVRLRYDGSETLHVLRLKRGDERVIRPRYTKVPEAFVVIDRGDDWFAIQENPVSVLDYLVFVNAAGDNERVPSTADGRQYFEFISGRWRIPESDIDGDPWSANWPMLLTSHDDAMAYVEWISQRIGNVRLPTVFEWEFAASGESRRKYPWGTFFHPAFTNVRATNTGRGMPCDMDAPTNDISPFGVRHMGGNVFNWTSTKRNDLYVFKGAAYNSMNEFAAIKSEGTARANERLSHIGFRLLLPL